MKPETLIKSLLWLYLGLLVFEGSLRKWILPGLADPLLVVRDPVVILIYLLALGQARFPFNGWVVGAIVLGAASLFASFLGGQDNLLITAYGLRINYLHLPLIWVMANVLTRRDVENFGKAVLILAIPLTLLMVVQFYSPPRSFINRGVGNDEGMGQLYGAMGHIRPPGFFAFITGPQLYFPLAMAFFCHELVTRRRLWWPLLIAAGASIIVAMPVSISRTLAIATAFVGAVFIPSLLFSGHMKRGFFRIILLLGLALLAASYLPVFDHAREAFLSRWETAEGHEGDTVGVGSILGRLFGGWDYLAYTFSSAPFFGHGVGMGSNVAARLSTGRLGFTLAENEWAKCLLELGPLLGLTFLGYRFVLALKLARDGLRRLFRAKDPLPLLLVSATGTSIVFGQWAPPTILGFAIFGSGLVLASCQDEPEDEEDDEEDDEFTDEEEGADAMIDEEETP